MCYTKVVSRGNVPPLALHVCFEFVVTCTPACQNGGVCTANLHGPWLQGSCDCPRGYVGSYCQYGGTYYVAACKKMHNLYCMGLFDDLSNCHIFDEPYITGTGTAEETCSPTCKNGGVCSSGFCNCTSGYRGSYCQYGGMIYVNAQCINIMQIIQHWDTAWEYYSQYVGTYVHVCMHI